MRKHSSSSSRRRFLQSVFATGAVASFFSLRAEFEKAPVRDVVDLEPLLSRVHDEHQLPAIAAMVQRGGITVAAGAAGVRKIGDPAAVTVQDKFHIGSCTKAMTSTLAARLIEGGKLRWETTLEETFPELSEAMHRHYRKVQLRQLLRHRSGAPANAEEYGPEAAAVGQQRLAYTKAIITEPPAKAGSEFHYSNAGYVIAGAMMERVTGRLWEQLMRERLFRPLGMSTAGFGPPSSPGQVDQPWGHLRNQGRYEPDRIDNPAVLGPAGTAHCSLTDYLKFADLHLTCGRRAAALLDPSSFAVLQKPAPGSEYACGWAVGQRSWACGRTLSHAGSNTRNYFVAWLAPVIDLALVVATNAGGGEMDRVTDSVAAELVRRFAGSAVNPPR